MSAKVKSATPTIPGVLGRIFKALSQKAPVSLEDFRAFFGSAQYCSEEDFWPNAILLAGTLSPDKQFEGYKDIVDRLNPEIYNQVYERALAAIEGIPESGRYEAAISMRSCHTPHGVERAKEIELKNKALAIAYDAIDFCPEDERLSKRMNVYLKTTDSSLQERALGEIVAVLLTMDENEWGDLVNAHRDRTEPSRNEKLDAIITGASHARYATFTKAVANLDLRPGA